MLHRRGEREADLELDEHREPGACQQVLHHFGSTEGAFAVLAVLGVNPQALGERVARLRQRDAQARQLLVTQPA
jgi:hypothetical protein